MVICIKAKFWWFQRQTDESNGKECKRREKEKKGMLRMGEMTGMPRGKRKQGQRGWLKEEDEETQQSLKQPPPH